MAAKATLSALISVGCLVVCCVDTSAALSANSDQVGDYMPENTYVTVTTNVDVCNINGYVSFGTPWRAHAMTTTLRRYVIYKRVSTAEQGKSGLGLEAQERDIRIFLETFSEVPWEVVGEFLDILSGADDSRPELAKAIDLAKREKATLLVSKLDRLSRDVHFISGILKDKKLDFRVAQMPSADKFQLHIYAALAEQEREFISQRTKAALKEAKARGQKLGGLRDKTMKRNEAVRANAVARAKKVGGIVVPLRDAGKTFREIAGELNRAGVQTARGGSWQPSQVMRVLERLGA